MLTNFHNLRPAAELSKKKIAGPEHIQKRHVRAFCFCIIVFLSDLLSSTQIILAQDKAEPGVCYASTGRFSTYPGSLLTIDLVSGKGALVGVSGLSDIPALAVNSKGEIFGTEERTGDLYRLDAKTGAATFVASTGLANLLALAFDESDVLYAASSDILITIDPATGIFTLVGFTEHLLEGLAFDPIDGTLWASAGSRIYMVDPNTATTTRVGLTSLGGNTPDLHFDSEGNLYGVIRGGIVNDAFISIDKATGKGTIIGPIGFSAVSGLAGYPARFEGRHIGVNRTSINFGTIIVDSSTTFMDFTIKSIGKENLTITSISIPDGPFRLSDLPALPFVLSPGQTLSFAVTFSPNKPGIINSTLSISSDDVDDSTRIISLIGEGFSLVPADPNLCYAGTRNLGEGKLIALDVTTGAGKLIGFTDIRGVAGLAINSRGIIHGINQYAGEIYLIDAVSGAAIFKANTGIFNWRAIAFDKNDVLYGIGGNRLFSIDLESGKPTLVASLEQSFVGMAFDPTDGSLWASTGDYDESADRIFIIDPITGAATLIGKTNLGGATPGIQFDAQGNLYGIKDGATTENILIAVDKISGAGVVIGPTGFVDISGIAFRPRRLEGRHIGLSATTIDFGTIVVDSIASARATFVRNIGTENVTVTGISTSDGPFDLQGLPAMPVIIQPGETLTFEVSFAPTEPGIVTRSITLQSDDLDDSVKTVRLKGDGFMLNPAELRVCYAMTSSFDDNPSSLIRIEPATGAATYLGTTGLEGLVDLAINSKGIILGLGGIDPRNLYYIDALSGAALFVASISFSGLSAIAFDGNDVLYGLIHRDVYNELYTIDIKTGATTLITQIKTFEDLRGMAIDPIDGRIWTSRARYPLPDEILTIDPTTGAVSLVGTTGLVGTTSDLQFDAEGNLFGVLGEEQSPRTLYSVDRITGAGNVIGSTGFRDITGLAFRPEKLAGRHVGVSTNILDFKTVFVDSISSPRIVTINSIGTTDVTLVNIFTHNSAFSLSGLPSLPTAISPGSALSFSTTFSPAGPGIVTGAIVIESDDSDDTVRTIMLRGEGFSLRPAQPGIWYASAHSSEGAELITINPTTAAGAFVGPTGLNNISGLAVNSKGIILGTDGGSMGDLHFVDAATGAATLATRTELWSGLGPIAFDGNDVLYAISGGSDLFVIDIQTGVLTFINSLPLQLTGLAFDPIDGTLWASAGSTEPNVDEIFTIDTKTGEATLIGKTGLGGATPAICFDNKGNLFGIKWRGNSESLLIAIDKSTGTGTIVGATGFRNVAGLVLRPEKPEGKQLSVNPSSIAFQNTLVDSAGSPRTVTIKSFGTEEATITEISLSDGPFRLGNLPTLPYVLPPGEAVSFTVKFSPTDTGMVTNTIRIGSNDIDDSIKTVLLTGKGFAPSLAKPGLLYASTGSPVGGQLITVNSSTGEGIFVASSNLDTVANLAINSRGLIYCTDGRTGDLYFIDAATGSAFLAASTGLPLLDALAFDKNDVLFGISFDNLYVIDPKSGRPAWMGLTEPLLQDLAFDPTSGGLWASKGGTGMDADEIFIVNPSNCRTSLIGKTGLGVSTPAIGFDAEGHLFGVSFDSRGEYVFCSIDRSTGSGTIIGRIGFRNITGLTFAPGKINAVADRPDLSSVPITFVMGQNFPNPFNPHTTIRS